MLKRYQKVLLIIFFLYTFVGFFLLPYLLKPQLKSAIESSTYSKVSIENISFNPYIFKLSISGIKLQNLENEQLFTLDSLSANLELYSLFNATVHLKELIVQNPKIFLVQEQDKSFNLLSIIKENNETKEQTSESSNPPRIKLDSIKIVDGSVSYEDYTRASKFDFVFERIGFELKDLDTNDFNASDAKVRFYSALGDGGFIDIKSDIVGFSPFIVKGSVDFAASKLYTQWRYVKDLLNLEIADGKLNFYTNYYFNLDDLNATTLEDMSIHLSGLRVKPKEQYKDVLNLDSLEVTGISVKPMLQEVRVQRVALDSLYVKAKRNAQGEIDWKKFVEFKSTQEAEVVEETNSTKPWDVKVKDLKLTNIQADFLDKAIKPQVDTKLNKLNIYAQDITLDGLTPLSYQIDMKLNEEFHCELTGDLAHKNLELNSDVKCWDFNLVHYRPYIDDIAKKSLQKYDIKLISSKLGFDSKVKIKEIENEIVISTQNTNVSIDNFKLNKKSTAKQVARFSKFSVKDLALNSKDKNIDIAKISLDGVALNIHKLKNMKLNVEDLVVPKAAKKAKKQNKKNEKEYRVKLKHYALNNAKVYFYDNTFTPSAKQKLDRINLNAYGIDSKKNSWLKYSFSSRVNSSSYIKSKGSLRHTPLKQKGNFELKHFSLSDLNPYIKDMTYTQLDDGYLSLKTQTEYSKSLKSPDLKVKGSMKLEDVFVNDTRDDNTILSFNEFGFKSFFFELQPNRLYVNEANLDAFYIDTIIDKSKQINFASLMKPVEKIESKEETNSTGKEEFPFRITKLDVNMGSAKFADYSIPIKFKTDIHDLDGHVYGISNLKDETSYVDIAGEIDKYGATSIKGSFNSDPKKYTEIDVQFKNLNLNSMSGYSASFAGYEIDDGKLFLDLKYNILNSNLQAENSVIVKKIELGKEFEDENVTSLPLGFVIALLEDKDGIIDIDMPVYGNVDEPDFKYGALVMKTLGNLLLKAVTSPFTFLGEMMGIDADKLGSLDFKAGEILITPPEREKLDNVAKMLLKRPKLSLNVSGTYDKVIDKRALQLEKLITLIVNKSGIKNRENHQSVMSIDLLEDIYEDAKDDNKLDEIEERLEKGYEGDAYDRAYKKELIRETMSLQEVSLEELKALAVKRAKVIKNYLVQEKNIKQERIVIKEIGISEYDEEKLVHTILDISVK